MCHYMVHPLVIGLISYAKKVALVLKPSGPPSGTVLPLPYLPSFPYITRMLKVHCALLTFNV
jgi:hypothetical protein